MGEHIIVWDLETVPDLDAVCRVHDVSGEDAARETLGNKFPKLPFHKIVCIGAVIAEKLDGVWSVSAIGAPHIGDRTEKQLIEAFADKVTMLRPCLVSFNGHGFDLPVLRYRAMMNRVSAPGFDIRSYFNRYSNDAIDLCDVLSSFDGRSKMKLNDLCRAMNLPGKPDDIDGSKVAEYFAMGRILEIANYCECDVISTYRLWLLYDLFRGQISIAQYEASEDHLSSFIEARLLEKPHWARLGRLAVSEPIVVGAELFARVNSNLSVV